MSLTCFIVKVATLPSFTTRSSTSCTSPRCNIAPSAKSPTPIIRFLRLSAAICATATILTFTSSTPSLHNLPHPPKTLATESTTQDSKPTTPYIYDNAKLLPAGEEKTLSNELATLEQTTGYRLLILTRTSSSPQIRLSPQITSPSSSTTLILIDPTDGNILRARPSSQILTKLTDSFWGEWTNRYGNQFYVRDRGGADLAAVESIRVLIECLKRDGTFRVVPHIGMDQEIVCASCAAFAGVVAGVASRTGGKSFNAVWLTLFAPLWATLLFSFGLGPVVVREGVLAGPTSLNLSLFVGTAVAAWWWIPIRFRGIEPAEKDPDI